MVSLLGQVGIGNKELRVEVFCRKGRHRSMICGWTLGRIAASMGFAVIMAVPMELDHKGRSRLCSDSACFSCHGLGHDPLPPLSAGEETFINWLTQTFMRTDGVMSTTDTLATVTEEWDYGPWGE